MTTVQYYFPFSVCHKGKNAQIKRVLPKRKPLKSDEFYEKEKPLKSDEFWRMRRFQKIKPLKSDEFYQKEKPLKSDAGFRFSERRRMSIRRGRKKEECTDFSGFKLFEFEGTGI